MGLIGLFVLIVDQLKTVIHVYQEMQSTSGVHKDVLFLEPVQHRKLS